MNEMNPNNCGTQSNVGVRNAHPNLPGSLLYGKHDQVTAVARFAPPHATVEDAAQAIEVNPAVRLAAARLAI